MQFADLKWWPHPNDGLGEDYQTSQRLRDTEGKRIYVLRWTNNEFTIMSFGADWDSRHEPGYIQYHRGLDTLDVNVRLLELEEDTREHKNFHINEPILPREVTTP